MENAQKIIEKIKSDQLKPIPAWKFRFKKILILFFYLLFVLIGAVSFSIILYSIQQADFDLLNHMEHSTIEFLLVLAPVVWLSSLIIFLLASIYSAQYTKKGYKITKSRWLILSTGLSMALGTLFFITGGANWFENSFANNLEIYQSIQEKKISIWNQPNEGRISGSIIDYKSDTIFLKDFQGHRWNVITENAFMSPRVLLEKGEEIKVNGSLLSDTTFHGTDIRPWGGNKFQNKNRKN